ncbi:MAG: Holliday junction branch migration protein RuvA [Flavobacteriales bacterium]|jgi:holliday junction DNA helicase RuvA|nr:Holliday junction branch migration protein RuvA [Flavobacteriales bacterium]
MIAQIQGKLIEKNPTDLVIDCQGVGYFIQISLHTFSKLPESDHIKVYIHQVFREDGQFLFGFADKVERELFRHLISVSGIGAGIARTMLSSLDPRSIIQALVNGDVATIQSIKGIGSKTAQRAVIELKEKMLKLYDLEQELPVLNNTNKDEALSALEVLGFNKKLAEKVVDKLLREQPESTVENIIKYALKNL